MEIVWSFEITIALASTGPSNMGEQQDNRADSDARVLDVDVTLRSIPLVLLFLRPLGYHCLSRSYSLRS